MAADHLAGPVPPAVLGGDGCRLHAISLEDWPIEQALSRDAEVVRWTYYPPDLTAEECRRRIKRTLDRTEQGLLRRYVIFDGQDAAVGTCGISELTSDFPRVFYALLPWARNQGIATHAVRLLAEWALANGYATALIETLDGNEASERVAVKAGFVRGDRFQADHRGTVAWLTRWTLPESF